VSLVKFNVARDFGAGTITVQRGLCNGPGLASGTEYSRWRSSTLDPGAPDKRDADLVLSRAEYARRRSSTLDPNISEMDRNSQEPSTLAGDRVLSVPRSLKDFKEIGFGGR